MTSCPSALEVPAVSHVLFVYLFIYLAILSVFRGFLFSGGGMSKELL